MDPNTIKEIRFFFKFIVAVFLAFIVIGAIALLVLLILILIDIYYPRPRRHHYIRVGPIYYNGPADVVRREREEESLRLAKGKTSSNK